MNNSIPDSIQDLIWRRTLSASERAALDSWLAQHPEARGPLNEERALTIVLGRLADAPLPSNFTARVLAELERVDRKELSGRPHPLFIWRWFSGWLPRAAVAGLVLGLSMLGWHQYRATVRAELATTLAEKVATLGPDVVENFDSVQRFAGDKPDLDLLKALE
jgi:anti-sigma factor RsiW